MNSDSVCRVEYKLLHVVLSGFFRNFVPALECPGYLMQ